MRRQPGQSASGGGGSSLSGGIEQRILAVANKLDGLVNSVERMRSPNSANSLSWSSFIGDTTAVVVSLRILKESIPQQLNAQTILPKDTQLDAEQIRQLPDLLYINPGEKGQKVSQDSCKEFKETHGRGLSTPQDFSEFKKKINDYNTSVDRILSQLHGTEKPKKQPGEKVKRTVDVKKSPYELQKEYDELTKMLSKIYVGTLFDPISS
eukprot:Trichotokara_eunicae@DN5263_c0_g1_i3.p1